MAVMGTIASALRLDSARATRYVGGTKKNAVKLLNKAGGDMAQAAKMRQNQIALRYGATALGVGVLGSQGKNRSSYRPARPMTGTPPGTGRFS